ncbi:MAG: hypothetical protein ACFFBH_14375 [Promethearchaeota archaeon]
MVSMNHSKENFNRLIYLLYQKKQILICLVSSLALLFVFFHVINLDANLGIENSSIGVFFSLILLISTVFIVLLLPFYPLYHIILKEKGFNFLERTGLTIISNLTFYILSGYIGNFFGVPMTGLFFILIIIITYFLLIIYIIFMERRKNLNLFLKSEKKIRNKEQFFINFSLKSYIKKKVPLISVLIICFLILLSILNGVRFSYFYGTDAMYHIFMTKLITSLNYLPINQYFGALGLHLFTAILYFFSGIDHLILAKYFSFYTFFASGLIIYNILKRIFKNRNLAVFGVFLLEFSSLGFSNMMYQFWPTSLATIQSLYILFILYARLQNFVKESKPTKKEILSNLIFSYILIILIYISALFTHSLIATIFMVSFTFIFLIYFMKSYRRGFDFLILCICLVIFISLFNFTEIRAHWALVDFGALPWFFFIFAGILGLILVLKLRIGIRFEKGRFKSTILGHNYRYYKIIEDKLLFPVFFSFIAVMVISFIFINIETLNVSFSKIIVVIEVSIFMFFGIWGLIIFQKKPLGKPLALWFLGLGIIYLGAFSLDIFVLHQFWSGRILLLFSPVIIFGFISYLFKLLKLKRITKIKIKVFILGVVIFMFISQFTDQLWDIDDQRYSLNKREVYSLQWYSNYTSEKNFLICEFGIPYVVMYYKYPYDAHNKSILVNSFLDFIQEPKGYFKPSDHFYANGTNKLQQMKQSLNTDIYLLLDANYLAFSGFEVYERLSPAEVQAYYNMNYLDRVCSSKSVNGIDFPYYWVI